MVPCTYPYIHVIQFQVYLIIQCAVNVYVNNMSIIITRANARSTYVINVRERTVTHTHKMNVYTTQSTIHTHIYILYVQL